VERAFIFSTDRMLTFQRAKMASRLAGFDPLKPSQGIARGFDNWKKEQVGNMHKKRLIELPVGRRDAKGRMQLRTECKK
jgi:hypothetical protein